MITINGRKFAEDKQEQAQSLFAQGGTVDGIAKRKGPTTVHLHKPNGELFAAIGRNGHGNFFVSATKREDGKTWYQYTLTSSAEEFFGMQTMGLVEQSAIVDEVCRQLFVKQHA